MTITKKEIKAMGPCKEGWEWYLKHPIEDLRELLITVNSTDDTDGRGPEWAWWILKNMLSDKKEISVKISIFAARLVINNIEIKYPENDAPRKVIKAAEAWVNNPTEENRSAALSAQFAALSAQFAAQFAALSAQFAARSAALSAQFATQSAALSAQFATQFAALSALSALSATQSAALSTRFPAQSAALSARFAAQFAAQFAPQSAALSARFAAQFAEKEIQEKILNYAVNLLEEWFYVRRKIQ